jgi:hypothetical protein
MSHVASIVPCNSRANCELAGPPEPLLGHGFALCGYNSLLHFFRWPVARTIFSTLIQIKNTSIAIGEIHLFVRNKGNLTMSCFTSLHLHGSCIIVICWKSP